MWPENGQTGESISTTVIIERAWWNEQRAEVYRWLLDSAEQWVKAHANGRRAVSIELERCEVYATGTLFLPRSEVEVAADIFVTWAAPMRRERGRQWLRRALFHF